jgi:hypothetical protein
MPKHDESKDFDYSFGTRPDAKFDFKRFRLARFYGLTITLSTPFNLARDPSSPCSWDIKHRLLAAVMAAIRFAVFRKGLPGGSGENEK